MKKIYTLLSLACSLLACDNIYSQVSITGPACVVPGTIYQYNITGNWDSASTMKICISGGKIYDSAHSNECTSTEPPIANLLVKWDANGQGSLNLTSTSGNTSLAVSVITPLMAGSIDSASLFQSIPYDSIPAVINCSANSGGSCNPSYTNQWQQSPDQVAWVDVDGANSDNLSILTPLTQTTFYRRKVTENISGTIAYSDVAVINVQIKSTSCRYSSKQPIKKLTASIIQKSHFRMTLNYENL